jgi:aspartokinase-like uncharacterized kinase
VVVKVGGALLDHADAFAAVLATIEGAACERPLLVVPGGGPFADAVRDVDARLALSDDAAHWMAVLAIDQYAQLLASRLGNAVLVDDALSVERALAERRIPVLAPSRWLRTADPLPHSWDVTSDSIAAWIAAAVGASELVLIKAARATDDSAVDRYFTQALAASLTASIVSADDIDTVQGVLRGSSTASVRFNATVR